MRRSCTNAPSAISSSHTSSWTNCEHASAALHRCSGSGWPSTPFRKLFLSSIWVHARKSRRIRSFTPCGRSWHLAACPFSPVTAYISTSMRLPAHFGHWLQVGRRGRKVYQWQVAAGLIYGQVKKTYQRRKLVRVTPVMRLETSAAFTAALQGLGLTGRLNTAFIERVNLTVRHGVAALARRTWATSQQGSQLLAHLARWQLGGATKPPAYACDGSRQNHPTMDGARGALLPIATDFRLRATTARCSCTVLSWSGW